MWKKKSIFWELPYWNVLEVRNAIDMMHLTKNICVNLLGFMGVVDTIFGHVSFDTYPEISKA